MSTLAPPTDPKVVKQMEKAIAKEAKADEKEYGRALKELKSTEKSETKAFKAVGKADKHLKKMEDKEHDRVRSLQKATHKHDQAVTSLHTAQGDIQIKNKRAEKLKRDTQTLRGRAEGLFRAKELREEDRCRKLAELHHDVARSSSSSSSSDD